MRWLVARWWRRGGGCSHGLAMNDSLDVLDVALIDDEFAALSLGGRLEAGMDLGGLPTGVHELANFISDFLGHVGAAMDDEVLGG